MAQQFDRRQMLKLFGAIGVSASAAPLLGACAAGQDANSVSGPPVTIGLITPSIGPYKPIGDEIANGFQLYLTTNARQLGRRIARIVPLEEGDNQKTLISNVADLIDNRNPLAIVGVASAPVMTEVAALAERNQIPLIGANASPVSLVNVRYVWRTSYVNNEPGMVLGSYMGQHKKDIGRVCIVSVAEPISASEEIVAFQQAFEAEGGKIVGDPIMIPFPSLLTDDTPEAATLVSKIKNSGADAVYCYAAGATAAAFIRAYRGGQIDKPLFGPGFLTEGTVLGDVGELALDITTVLNYSADLNNEENNQFVVAYAQEIGRLPSTYAVAAWDAASVLSKAILAAGRELDPRTLNSEIGRLGTIDSPRGRWQFNASRTPTQTWYLRTVGLDGVVPANITEQRLAVLS